MPLYPANIIAQAATPVQKLQNASRMGLRSTAVSATPPTISTLGPNGSNQQQATGIASGVLCTAQTYMAQTATWPLLATTGGGIPFYQSNMGGVDTVGIDTIGFWTDAQVVEICNRRDEYWQVLVNNELISATKTTMPTGSAYGLTRLVLTFASRLRRKFICFGQSSGYNGIGIGPQDTIETLDWAKELSFGVMSDSYGGSDGGTFVGGPFFYAAFRLQCGKYCCSTGGGSGYDTNGTGGENFNSRLAEVLASNPDVMLFSGGINDATFANAGTVFAAARSGSSRVIVVTAPWTPANASRSAGSAKRDTIYAALSAIAGPWIFVDNIAGTWISKRADGTLTTKSSGAAPWQTGNGYVGATTSAGNGDFYVSDGVHPSQPAGVRYLGELLASSIAAAAEYL